MDVKTGLHLMTSASGVATAEGAIYRPVNLLMSGPVAGVVGGIWAGQPAGYDNVITLDVGGTSADIGLAQDGRLRMKHLLDTRVGPYQAMIPMVDVDTIGAGGGSIAYVDGGGIFRVAPLGRRRPGPAAYGRGGTEPTATDAMVNLGWLLPETFLGGGMSLDADAARDGVRGRPGAALGMTVEEASMGAIQILTHSMVQSIEENSVRKGYDPRDFALVAEGGAGPLFAAQIALEVGHAVGGRPELPGGDRGARPARDGHGLRVRLDRLRAPLDARRGGSPAGVRGARAAGARAARGRRRPGRADADPARRRLPLPRAGLRAPRRRRLGRDRRRVGGEGRAPTSTTSTSASTRGASRTPTSRSRTSASAGSG